MRTIFTTLPMGAFYISDVHMHHGAMAYHLKVQNTPTWFAIAAYLKAH
jgi:hypothetical protein